MAGEDDDEAVADADGRGGGVPGGGVSTADDAQQLKIYQEQFPLFWNDAQIKGITLWGYIYGSTWSQAPYSGLIRNGAPRPALTWLMGYIGR